MSRKLVFDPNVARELYAAGKTPKTKAIQKVPRLIDSGGGESQAATPIYANVVSEITPTAGNALASVTPSKANFVTAVNPTSTTISYVESLTGTAKEVCTDVSVSNGALVFTFEEIQLQTPTTQSVTFNALGLVQTAQAVTGFTTTEIQPVVSIAKEKIAVVRDIESNS